MNVSHDMDLPFALCRSTTMGSPTAYRRECPDRRLSTYRDPVLRVDDLDPVAPARPYVDAACTLAAGRHTSSSTCAPTAAATPTLAAGHITPIRLAPTVRAHLPEAYVIDSVTATNWEGRGVVPDVACPAGDALDVAIDVAIAMWA